jgi:hypothetical protein
MRISMRVLNDVGVKSVMQSIFSIGDFRPVRSLTRFPATDTHLPLLRLPLASSVFREGCVYSDPMEGTPEGLTDKVFWRKARGQWHGFKRLDQARKYISLCQRQEIAIVRGQQIARPEAHLRCGLCDELEIAWRGWGGSGPASSRRAGSFSR